jgi:hypothetical protein
MATEFILFLFSPNQKVVFCGTLYRPPHAKFGSLVPESSSFPCVHRCEVSGKPGYDLKSTKHENTCAQLLLNIKAFFLDTFQRSCVVDMKSHVSYSLYIKAESWVYVFLRVYCLSTRITRREIVYLHGSLSLWIRKGKYWNMESYNIVCCFVLVRNVASHIKENET